MFVLKSLLSFPAHREWLTTWRIARGVTDTMLEVAIVRLCESNANVVYENKQEVEKQFLWQVVKGWGE